MSEDSNPFADQAIKTRGEAGISNQAWIAAGIMAVPLIVMSLLWAGAAGRLRGLESLPGKLENANGALTNALLEIQKAKEEIAGLQNRAAELEKEKEKVGQTAKGLEDEMRSELESKDVTISNLKGKLTVNILDHVMFDSGEAALKPEGESVLRKIGPILAGHPEIKIQVIGHTDNVPVRNRFASNWELSTARALAAVHFLTEKVGVDPRRVGVAGYGEYRPIASNANAEGRARNRRIAITILPDEIATAETPAKSASAPETKNEPTTSESN